MTTIEERVRYLFEAAIDAGADTDAWSRGPEHVETMLYLITKWRDGGAGAPQRALDSLDAAHDPVWEPLRWYLRGLVDAQQLQEAP